MTKIEHKIILELTVKEATALRDFLCEFEGKEFGGSRWDNERKRKDWIQWLLYDLSVDLEKFGV